MPSFANAWCGADAFGGCLVCESPVARHARWDREYEHARRARTDAFYAQRASAVEGVKLGEPTAGQATSSGGGDGGSGSKGGDTKGDATDDDHPYTEMRDDEGVAVLGVPLRAEVDTHCGEKLQGRLCATALFGCCCAGCIIVTHGCGAGGALAF